MGIPKHLRADAAHDQSITEPVAPFPQPFAHGRLLYRLGSVAAFLTALLIPVQLAVFLIWPPPLGSPVQEWFRLFQKNALLGLLGLDVLLLVDYVLLIPIILALYVLLRPVAFGWAVGATALFFVAIASYFASNTSLEMLSLSRQYAAATAPAERALYAAAGQGMLATFEGTAFHVSYILGSLAGIGIGVAMVQSQAFSRLAAYAAIAGNGIGLGLYLPGIGIWLSVLSVPLLWVWYVLIGRRFWELSRATSEKDAYHV